MRLEGVHGHTIDTSILGDGVVIDIGCRGFEFANYFTRNKVFCVDVDPSVFAASPFTTSISGPMNEVSFNHKHTCFNVAIHKHTGTSTYYPNGEMTILTDIYQPLKKNYTPCKTITMADLYKETGDNVEILKLDCEGAEYFILGEGFLPIPKQISVEFHKHYVPKFHEQHYSQVINTLAKDYKRIHHENTLMNSLFILKTL